MVEVLNQFLNTVAGPSVDLKIQDLEVWLGSKHAVDTKLVIGKLIEKALVLPKIEVKDLKFLKILCKGQNDLFEHLNVILFRLVVLVIKIPNRVRCWASNICSYAPIYLNICLCWSNSKAARMAHSSVIHLPKWHFPHPCLVVGIIAKVKRPPLKPYAFLNLLCLKISAHIGYSHWLLPLLRWASKVPKGWHLRLLLSLSLLKLTWALES